MAARGIGTGDTVGVHGEARVLIADREFTPIVERALDGIAADRSLRAVVLAGAGRGFCAGHGLKEMRAHSDALAGAVRRSGGRAPPALDRDTSSVLTRCVVHW